MEASNQLSILLVTDSKDYIESLGGLIRSHYTNFTLAKDENQVLSILENQPIDLMMLGFETVQKNEVFYLHLLRARRDIDRCIRYIMLLAIKQDVQTAFDSCFKNIFNDYYLACPMYDLNYILIRLREIERMLYNQTYSQSLPLDDIETYLEQMLTSGERLGVLNSETEHRIQQTLHEAMDHLRHQLEQQGADSQTLQTVTNQAQVSSSSALANNPQLYESGQLVKTIVTETRKKKAELGRAARGRNGIETAIDDPIESRTPDLNTSGASLSEELSNNDEQTRMDRIAPDNPQPNHGIMIIEDEMKQLSSVNEVLAKLGLVTYPVQTGSEALKNMAKWQPSIALVDLTLPDISALHVISRITNHPDLQRTRVIAMANQNERDIVLEAAKAGIKQVVLKPVDKKLLTQRIHNNLKAIENQTEPV